MTSEINIKSYTDKAESMDGCGILNDAQKQGIDTPMEAFNLFRSIQNSNWENRRQDESPDKRPVISTITVNDKNDLEIILAANGYSGTHLVKIEFDEERKIGKSSCNNK